MTPSHNALTILLSWSLLVSCGVRTADHRIEQIQQASARADQQEERLETTIQAGSSYQIEELYEIIRWDTILPAEIASPSRHTLSDSIEPCPRGVPSSVVRYQRRIGHTSLQHRDSLTASRRQRKEQVQDLIASGSSVRQQHIMRRPMGSLIAIGLLILITGLLLWRFGRKWMNVSGWAA